MMNTTTMGEGSTMPIRGTRTLRLRVAAILSVAVAIVSICLFDLPVLAEGTSDSSDPFALVLGSFASDVLALVAAYGAVRRQRWGVILLIIVLSFWALQAGAALLDGDVVLGTTMLAISLGSLWCCLAPDGSPPFEPTPGLRGDASRQGG